MRSCYHKESEILFQFLSTIKAVFYHVQVFNEFVAQNNLPIFRSIFKTVTFQLIFLRVHRPVCSSVGQSVTRVLLSRYVGNLQRIFDYSPLDPTQDFATQM